MRFLRVKLSLLPLLFAGIVVVLLSGCATDDSNNESYRPWNGPKSWENGLPPAFMEGR